MSSTLTGPQAGFTPSIIILNNKTQQYVDNANNTIGPWVVGTFADLFLQGILVTQTAHYFTCNIRDPSYRRFTRLVLLVTILCLLKSVQNVYIVWETVVTNFGNPDLAERLPYTAWWAYTRTLTTAIIATIVQYFFMYRYWLLTRRKIICGVIICGMALSLVAASLNAVSLSKDQMVQMKTWSLVHFVSAIITDAIITSLTVYYLYQKKSIVRSTTVTPGGSYLSNNGLTSMEMRTAQSNSDMIDGLVRMVWQSALPPTLCVTIDCILLKTIKQGTIHTAFNLILPKLYAISLMYTLNLRNELRGARNTPDVTSTQSHLHRSSFPLSRRPLSNVQREAILGPNNVVVVISALEQQTESGRSRLSVENASERGFEAYAGTIIARREQKLSASK